MLLFYSIILLLAQSFIPPPGTTAIAENRFIDEHLLTYDAYYEFLENMPKRITNNQYSWLIPKDTSVTYKGKKLWGNRKYLDYPIVGLDRKQIEAYCKWRSDAVNSWKNHPENRICRSEYWEQFDKVDPDCNYEVKYTLPTNKDLMSYQPLKEKYWLTEMTDIGEHKRSCSKKISHLELKVFRCVAYYQRIE